MSTRTPGKPSLRDSKEPPLNEPLPDRGLQILTDLITHQDSTTWTAMSVFVAAELILFAVYAQALPNKVTLSLAGTLGVFGLSVTAVSWYVLERSNRYLEAYYGLAKARCNPQDLPIFDVKIARIPRTRHVLAFLHFAFLILWSILVTYYFLILWIMATMGWHGS